MVRSPFLSFASILIVTITLFIVGLSVLTDEILDNSLQSIRDKVDITVYFIKDTPEYLVLDFKEILEAVDEVESVTYVSQEEALLEYKVRHEAETDLLEGLAILDENPFRPRLSIKAYDANDFEAISRFLVNEDILSDNPQTIIDKIDYTQNKLVIDRLLSIINAAGVLSTSIVLLLGFISFLIIFTTIRIVISSSEGEINVMHLMGATNFYIKGPFLVSGALYGFIGAIFATIFIYPLMWWIAPITKDFFGDITLLDIYFENALGILLSLLLLGVLVGIISSWFSTEKYLK